MGYIHKGGLHDFEGKETEYGKDLAEKFGPVETREERAKKNFKKALKEWKEKVKEIDNQNAELKRDYEDKFKKWEKQCEKSFIGFFIRIFKISKPKLRLLEKPLKSEYENMWKWQ